MAKAGWISGKLTSTNVIEAPLRDKAGQFFNVKAYGAVGDGVISAGAVSGTDDTAAIQSAINAAHTAGGGTVYFPAGIYIQNSQLTLVGKKGVTLQGASGGVKWTFNPVSEHGASLIVYKGTGTSPGWNCDSSLGTCIRDLDISYDSSSFTGPLMRFAFDSVIPASTLTCEHVRFVSFSDTLKSAKCLLSLKFMISATFYRCSFYGADWLVRGFETNGGSGESPNSITFKQCLMQGAVSGFFANIGDWWTIEDNTFEAFPITGVGPPLCIVGGDVTGTKATFCYRNNQHWDCDNTTCIPIKQPANQEWMADFDGNFFDATFIEPYMEFDGTGCISITNNSFQKVVNGSSFSTLIDLGTTAKRKVLISGNDWTSASNNCPNIINNIGPHEEVIIENNNPSAWGKSIRTVSGHERLGYIGGTAQFQPTISAAAGQTLGTIAIYGSDVAGYILIQAGGSNSIAGRLLDVTFARAMTAHPSVAGGIDANHHIPSVLLTPLETDSGGGTASVDAGVYVKTYFNDRTKFSICTKNAVPAGTVIQYAYRVIQV